MLEVNNPLFEKLSSNPPQWWNTLVKDEDISIQVRKDNYIDVYFNGGAIIQRLTFNGQSFRGEIHCKFIPVENEKGKETVPFLFEKDSIEFGKARVMPLDCFNRAALKRIKENISGYFPPDSEKAIQYAFIKNDPYFIDSEFQYRCTDGFETKTIRMDLVRLDVKLRKIVFVEVKRFGDKRLYNNEIASQLKGYKQFITAYKSEIIAYYKKIFEIKRNLGLLHECLANETLNDYEVLEKPLLLLGDCAQEWIAKYSKKLDDRIRVNAAGCYYFGQPTYLCNLLNKTKHNRHIF